MCSFCLPRRGDRIPELPGIEDRPAASGFDSASSKPQQLDAFGKSESAKLTDVVKASGVCIDRVRRALHA